MNSILAADTINLFDINTIWWFLQRGVLNIIDGLNQAFYLLAGVTNPFQGGEENPGIGDNALLVSVFKSPEIQKTFMNFCGAALFLAAFCFLLSILKNLGKSDGIGKTHGASIVRFGKSIIFMFSVPILFLLGIYAVTYLLNFMCSVMGGQISATNSSIAQSIFEICCPEGAFGEGNIKQWNTVTYEDLKRMTINETYDYTLGIFAGCLIIFSLVKVCILLVERFIDVMWLYLSAPFVMAKLTMEKDMSVEQWKEQVLVKLLSVAGIVICMYLYFFIIPMVDKALKVTGEMPFQDKLGRLFTRLLFIIGGAFAISKGSVKLATLISAGAAQTEGMSAAETSRMISGGTQMALGGMTKALGGAVAGGIAGLVGGGAAKNLLSGAGAKMMNGAGSALGGGGSGGGVAGAVTGGGGGSARKANKSARQQARMASRQQQFMTGTNFGSVAARGGVMGMLGYGGAKLVGAVGKGLKGLGRSAKKGVGHIKQNRASLDSDKIGKKGSGYFKRALNNEVNAPKIAAKKERKLAAKQDKAFAANLKKQGGVSKRDTKNLMKKGIDENAGSNPIDKNFNKRLAREEKQLDKFDKYMQKKNIDSERAANIRKNVMEARLSGLGQTVDEMKKANLDKALSEKTMARLQALKEGNKLSGIGEQTR